MIHQHHRVRSALAITLTAAACTSSAMARPILDSGAGAASAGQPTGVCSELCSGSGYAARALTAPPSADPDATLPHNAGARGTVGTSAGVAIHATRPAVVHVASHDNGFD